MDAVDEKVPPAFNAEFARVLSTSQQELLDMCGKPGLLFQAGAAYIGGPFPVPRLDHPPAGHGAAIETFVVDDAGTCTPTGTNWALVSAFQDAANDMATLVLDTMAGFGVTVDGPCYLTVSVTPWEMIDGNPHVDDEQYNASDGPGFVATVADVGGSRVACGPISHRPARNGVPITMDPSVLDDFTSGAIPAMRVDAGRISVFPQFGQVHAGPTLATSGDGGMRNLLVLRARTKSHAAVAPPPRQRRR